MDKLHILYVGNDSDALDLITQNDQRKSQILSLSCEKFSKLSEIQLNDFSIIFLSECSESTSKINLLKNFDKALFGGILILLINADELDIAAEAMRSGADAVIFKQQLTLDLLNSLPLIKELESQNPATPLALRDFSQCRDLITAKMNMATAYADHLSANLINLLTVVTMNADIALMKIEPDHSLRKEISAILSISEKLMAINNQLMTIGTTQRYWWKMIDLNSILSEEKTTYSELLGKDIQLEYDLADDIEFIAANEQKLQTLISNLVINASESLESQGIIRLTTRNVELENNSELITSPSVSGQFVQLKVEDTGCGICGLNFSRIFDPFFTTKPNAINAGLGLSEVFGIVKQADGHIGIESEPGSGTRISIYFPAMKLK